MEQIIIIYAVILLIVYMLMPAYIPQTTVMWFFSESCGHCTRMEPEWKKFAAVCPLYITIKKIDISQNQQMAQDYGVNGVPYIVKVVGSQRAVYQGDRSAQDIYNFATSTF